MTQTAPRSKPKIVIVDDDADCMRLLAHALNAAGFHTVSAFGGEDAIRKTRHHKPDMVLTDLAMPKVSGVEVICTLKSDPDTRHIPVLAVTSYIWDWIARSAGQAGCDGYIRKPFRSKELIAKVREFLGEN